MARYTHGDIRHRNSRDDVDEELSLEGGRAEWWYTVESEEGKETVYNHDCLALAAILRFVPSDMPADLGERRTASAAWASIKKIHLGAQQLREPNVLQLCRAFGALIWKEV